ncbi:MAG: bifunctional 5,10-methylenetetrahydrofolate dehydrogenase/5,10-methenyltetrahydrofolate cyclohydrolase [Candidatus Eremiobacteraeota bacterium]|nr:bifunctional 5,10-methylenetetrahydrofolate dehydrogenase/5,10-methenyltetrahydrofolate cyclohydrolase [Candidatus Eremiobacteraeota bacterium]
MAIRIDGRALGETISRGVGQRAMMLHERGTKPRCCVIVAPDDEPGLLYARATQRKGEKLGIAIDVVELEGSTAMPGALAAVNRASCDPLVHGIIIQRPLPRRYDEFELCSAIEPSKDVDGANPLTYGMLMAARPTFVPATAAAVIELLRLPYLPAISGAHAIVLGRSKVAGGPIAALLTAADATVTLCHSRTRRLADLCRLGDIVIAAVGRPLFVTAEMVKPQATVIDVGTNVCAGRITGDVDAQAVDAVAAALSPVPGGVGPVTAAVLLRNVVSAAEDQRPK